VGPRGGPAGVLRGPAGHRGIKANVKEQILTLTVGGKPEEIIEKVLRTANQARAAGEPLDFDQFIRERLQVKRPVVIMFVGVNGTGKTTSNRPPGVPLKEQGLGVVLAAGDTFRAGAIGSSRCTASAGRDGHQHKAGADPAAVATTPSSTPRRARRRSCCSTRPAACRTTPT